MVFQQQTPSLIAAIAFLLAAAFGFRNYLLTKKASNLWLWLSIAMALISLSRFSRLLTSTNPLWEEATASFLLSGALLMTIVLFDFEKGANLCAKCTGSLAGLPRGRGAKDGKTETKGL